MVLAVGLVLSLVLALLSYITSFIRSHTNIRQMGNRILDLPALGGTN